jgi:hypothetical protein
MDPQKTGWHLQQLFPFGRQWTATITVRDNAHVTFGAESFGKSWRGAQYQTNISSQNRDNNEK